jgi:hypothetical protein
MGLIQKQEINKQEIPLAPDQLNAQELEFLLLLIKQSTFLGENVEKVYNTTLKLQNQYLKQTK